MTHSDLVRRAARWLCNTRRCSLVFIVCDPETKQQSWEIPDTIGFFPDGKSVVVDAKASRADFLADRRKPSRIAAADGGPRLGDERWYLTPPGVIDWRSAARLPAVVGLEEGFGDLIGPWGVLELVNGRCYRRRPATVAPTGGTLECALLVALLRRGEKPWMPSGTLPGEACPRPHSASS